jgi:GT2 family glycosyltransferase
MISIIMVQHNNAELSKEAIRSLKDFHREGYEIILVDNGSTGNTLDDLVCNFPDVQVIKNEENVGFGSANNLAARVANGEILFFLNNDTVCQSEFLSSVTRQFAGRPEVGIIGPKLLNTDGSLQLSAGRLPTFWGEIGDKVLYWLEERRLKLVQRYIDWKFSHMQPVGWVTGAALFIRKELFMQIGGFDEKMFLYFEDKDLCLRVTNAGNIVVYNPTACLVHAKGGSSKGDKLFSTQKTYRKSQLWYYQKHRPPLERLLLKMYLHIASKYPN